MNQFEQKSKAYLIRRGKLIAIINTDLPEGTIIQYGFHICKEKQEHGGQYYLFKSRSAKITRTKQDGTNEPSRLAEEINPKQFYIALNK